MPAETHQQFNNYLPPLASLGALHIISLNIMTHYNTLCTYTSQLDPEALSRLESLSVQVELRISTEVPLLYSPILLRTGNRLRRPTNCPTSQEFDALTRPS
jgi:hypothetical protein